MKIRNLLIALVAVSFIAVPAIADDTCATAVAPGVAVDPCLDPTPTGPLGSCTSGGGVFDNWYTFVATATDARLRTDLSSAGTDSNYVVYHSPDTSCNAAQFVEVGCSEDEAGYLGDIVVKLLVGDTYYVQLGSWGDSCSGGYVLDVIEPSDIGICGDGVLSVGEVCDSPQDAACPGLCTVKCTCSAPPAGGFTCATAVASGVPTDPCADPAADQTGPVGSCATGGGVLDTWYTFVATATSARIRTDVGSVGTDSNYGVYSGACGALTEIACSEDDGTPNGPFLGDISVEKLVVGDTYWVQLGTWGDNCPNGPYVVDVTMPSTSGICGNNVVDAFQEDCDGTDDANCPTLCTPTCNCPPPICGNNITEAGEECDGNNAKCLLACLPPGDPNECECEPIQTPALPAWGVVGLALLLLAGGAFAFRRRSQTA